MRTILHTGRIVPFHTNPKRKQRNDLPPSLTLRPSVTCSRVRYIFAESCDNVFTPVVPVG